MNIKPSLARLPILEDGAFLKNILGEAISLQMKQKGCFFTLSL
jgi:hypothetical protein